MKIAQEQLVFPSKVHIHVISSFLSVTDEHLSIFKPKNDSHILISNYYVAESSPSPSNINEMECSYFVALYNHFHYSHQNLPNTEVDKR